MSISGSHQTYECSNEYICIRSDAAQAQSQSQLLSQLTPSSLFSSFVSLAATLLPKSSSNDTPGDPLEPFHFKDLGIINQDLIPLGYGSSFMVSVFYKDEKAGGVEQIVLKRTIPLAKKQNDTMFQNRIKAMMLELRTLAHDPIRKHENIVNLLGLAWETDPFDIERKWPVFLVERATKGTLLDLFQKGTPFSLPIRLNLILDIVLGLEVLHLCGIIHGDVKLENALVFDNPDSSILDRPFIAKLADFGGSSFDVSASSYLPSGTQPWNAPEWRKQLDPESLKLTDIYSLRFVIWRVFANGKHPFLARDRPASQELWLKEVEDLKANDEDMQKHLLQIPEFEIEIERQLLMKIIMQTVRTDPTRRNVVEAKLLVEEAVKHPRLLQTMVALADINYSSQNVMDKIDPAILLYISKELLRVAQVSGRPEEAAEAKYGLAVLSINRAIDYEQEGSSLEAGLKWLTEAAEAGCERAQAIFYRLYKVLTGQVPDHLVACAICWLLTTASKGYFQSLEDIRELIPQENVDDVLRTLQFRYGGTGSRRHAEFLPPIDARQPWQTCASKMQVHDNLTAEALRGLDRGYTQGGLGEFGHGDNPLHYAASCGLKKTVAYLIGKDSDNVNFTNVNGETPLLLACRSGHYSVTMELLEAGADPKIASNSGDTPLHWLLSFDSKYVLEVCQHLVAKLDQTDLDAVASEWGYIYCGENKFILGSPLMRAVSRDRKDVVQALLEAGADPCLQVNRCSALHIAAQLHYPHMIHILLAKSPPNSLGGMAGYSIMQSLLMTAITCGSLEAPGTRFARIRRHGHRWRSRAHETLKLLLDLGSRGNVHDPPGGSSVTALAVAAYSADVDVVEFLLQHGYKDDIDKPSIISEGSAEQHTPLSACVLSKNFPVFLLLVANGANTKTLSHGPIPYTLLYECAQSSNDRIEFARRLIDSGVQVDESPEGYETPFACALRNRCFQLAKCLWENGANVNVEYSDGCFRSSSVPLTVLGHLIAEYTIGSLSCLSFLLCHRPQLSATDFVVSRSAGLSALHVIALAPYRNQNDNDSRLILGHVLDYFSPSHEQLSLQCSIPDFDGFNALHIAAVMSNSPIVRGLLSVGADPFTKTKRGHTALDIAYDTVENFSTAESISMELPEGTLKKIKEAAEDVLKTIKSACDSRRA